MVFDIDPVLLSLDKLNVTFTNTINGLATQRIDTALFQVVKHTLDIKLGTHLADRIESAQRQVVMRFVSVKAVCFTSITPNHFASTIVATVITFLQTQNAHVLQTARNTSFFFQCTGNLDPRFGRIVNSRKERFSVHRLSFVIL